MVDAEECLLRSPGIPHNIISVQIRACFLFWFDDAPAPL